MLATISPCAGHVEETLSTLRYACQVSSTVQPNTGKKSMRLKLSYENMNMAMKMKGKRNDCHQARTIINTARISEDPNARLIRHLREQIKLLEKRTQESDVRVSVETVVNSAHHRVGQLEEEIDQLKERLVEAEQLKDQSWQEKVTEAEEKRHLAEQMLLNYGLSTHKDPNQPCLVNVCQVLTFF